MMPIKLMPIKMKNIEKALLCGLVVAILAASFAVTGFSAFSTECGNIRQSVLRLHILANSDSTADQKLKIEVRNAVLAEPKQLFATAKNKQEAEQNAKASLPAIKKIAQAMIKKEGFTYSADAKLVNMYFTTRTYGSVTLPAGYYDAVRVTLGRAAGHNWWCVLFPPLCLPAAMGNETVDDVLSHGETSIVKSYQKPDVQIKFKVVEWFEGIVQFFKKR